MARTGGFARWAVIPLLLSHGLVHLLGPLEIWGIANIDELTGQPDFALSQTSTDVVAGVWLVAMALLTIASIALLRRRGSWRAWAVAGVVVSQLVILIVAAVLLAKRLDIGYRK